ncbi:alanine-glyoxylate amino-transferase [Coriobacteriaceae bacterium BV3Ac1]|nr:alanine-glyoxylate amino-transferase [Coriobacteriaceae bacterium BV3Ac1]
MKSAFDLMDTPTLDAEIASLESRVDEVRARKLSLDMARGKPSPEQTNLSRPMLDLLSSSSDFTAAGGVADNYGFPDGLPKTRELAAELLGVDPANVVVSGSSSLHLMHDLVVHGYTRGVAGQTPWCKQDTVKWLCPSPGYDRHFRVTETYGIQNIPIPMTAQGPDMDLVEQMVNHDSSVKGIWCVPKYANPNGITYSDEVVRRFAALKPAAPDFRIYWDNAYIVHDLYDEPDQLLNIFDAMREVGTSNLVYEFASTSKVTFPGSGLAWITADPQDMVEVRGTLAVEQVGPEKLTQLAHVLFLRDAAGVRAHMKKHAAIVRPRFELVERKLSEGLSELHVARWSHPRGGYFVSFDGPEGSARAVVALMAELGVKMTGAGATWPGGIDPHDTNIRIAPTYPSLEELACALDVFVLVVKLVAARLARTSR